MNSSFLYGNFAHYELISWNLETHMTKSQKYRIAREFKRKTFDTNPTKRFNYVHKMVRFNAYLVIR